MIVNPRTFLLISSVTVGFLLALALTPVAMRLAARLGFVDRPGGHKSHERVTPYLGGVAVFWAAWLPLIAALGACWAFSPDATLERFGELAAALHGGLRERTPVGLALILGGAVLHALGLIDDRRALGPRIKLAVMVVAALIVVFVGDMRLAAFLGPIGGTIVTVLWIVVIVNAFNFLDNMDGLSAGVAVLCLVFLALCGVMAGQLFVPALALLFAGSLLGFLVFNFPPASIFMGDAGSLVTGFMLATITILTVYWQSATSTRSTALVMPLVILAVPLYDFVSVVVIRLRDGRSPFRGDQRHFSHRLVDRGLSRRQAVLTIYLATCATGLSATLLPDADARTTLTVLGFVVMVLLIIAILEAPNRSDAS